MKPRLSCSCWGSCFSRFRRSSSISLFRHTGNQSRTRLAAFLTAAAAALTFNVASAGADVIYVKHDATGANDGTSWANAHLYLREALARAVAGDDVWVAAGTYRPDESTQFPAGDGDPDKSFEVRTAIRLLGGFAGDESSEAERSPTVNPVVLDGRAISRHVVNAAMVTPQATLDGLQIQGGYNAPFTPNSGAGVWVPGGDLQLINCTIADNECWNEGGAIYAVDARVRLVDCVVRDNQAIGAGGAIYAEGAEIVAIRTSFVANESGGRAGGAIYGGVGGLYFDCRFERNGTDDWGGAASNTSAAFVNCKFIGQYADVGAESLYAVDGPIFGCLFMRSFNADRPSVNAGRGAIINCTFADPYGGGSAGMMVIAPAGMYNSIVWPDMWLGTPLVPAGQLAEYCCIRGWTAGGPGNISTDPLFADADGPDDNPLRLNDNDLRLLPGSPCIDAGANLALPPDTYDIDEDGDTAEQLPIDLDGAGRRADIPSRPDTGAGSPPIVDMGAFEMHCPGDVNGDGAVDLDDLAQVLIRFGANPARDAEGDLDLDGRVDLGDLAIVLAMFGVGC